MVRLLVFLFGLLISCAPISESVQYALLPPEEEIKLGKMYVPSAIAENEGLYPDSYVQEYVSNLGRRLASLTPRKLPYRFYVVNSSVENAFALPGGPIFVTRGLILMLDSESELAAVLGHELGHLNRRHHARYLEKVLGLSLLLQITQALIGKDEGSRIVMMVANAGAYLLALKFSRDQEREADDFGIELVSKAGYDPYGFIGVFEKFKKLGKNRLPRWLSTHPLPEERIKRVTSLVMNYRKPGLKMNSETFAKVKDRILSTKASFDLYEEGRKLYSKGKKMEALAKFQQAIELFEKNQMAHIYTASILTEMGRNREALYHASRATDIDPQLLWGWFVKGAILFNMGRYRESVEALRTARKLVPSYPDTYYYLGRNYEALGMFKMALRNYEKALKLAGGKEPWLEDAKRRYNRLKRWVG